MAASHPLAGVDSLPAELWVEIFVHLAAPQAFSATCKAFHSFATDPSLVARYWLSHHGRIGALTAALGTKTLTPDVVERLLTMGAGFSRNLFSLIGLAFREPNGRIDGWLPPKWARKDECLGGLTYLALHKAALAIGWNAESYSFEELDSLLGEVRCVSADRVPLLPGMLRRPPTPDSLIVLEFLLAELKVALEGKRFMPIPGDPVNLCVARSACLEPKMVPWLAACGWYFTYARRDELLLSLLTTSWPPIEPVGTRFEALRDNAVVMETRTETVSRAIRDYVSHSNGAFQVSATICGQLMCEYEEHAEHFRPLRNISIPTDPVVHFAYSAIAVDLLRLAHNTRATLVCTSLITRLYNSFIKPDPVLSADPTLLGLYHLVKTVKNELAGVVESRIDTPENVKRLSQAQMEDALVEVLCSEFLVSPQNILFAHASTSVLDLSSVAQRAAVRLLRQPSKGATLLSLTTLYPSIVSFLRAAVLAHKPVLERLPTPRDPSRPLYSARPKFLSPLAFDYQNAMARYPLGLGPQPWVEECYDTPTEDRCDVALSVWPLEPVEYSFERKNGEMVETVSLGRVDGRGLKGKEADWVRARVPRHGSLPVAIALLDLFKKDDETLDVMLSHAILNLNAPVVDFYLKDGVPLREHHLAFADLLGVPRLQAIKDHLMRQVVKEACGVEESLPVGKKDKVHARRKRKHGKAAATCASVRMEVEA